MSLERVIAEQQAEIDRLKIRLEASHKQAVLNAARERELFQHVLSIVEFGVGRHWKDEDSDELKRYRNIQHELRMHMMSSGFCMHCKSFQCECNENDF